MIRDFVSWCRRKLPWIAIKLYHVQSWQWNCAALIVSSGPAKARLRKHALFCICIVFALFCMIADQMEHLWETHGRRLSEAGLRRGSGGCFLYCLLGVRINDPLFLRLKSSRDQSVHGAGIFRFSETYEKSLKNCYDCFDESLQNMYVY